jgi:hypothetical protein
MSSAVFSIVANGGKADKMVAASTQLKRRIGQIVVANNKKRMMVERLEHPWRTFDTSGMTREWFEDIYKHLRGDLVALIVPREFLVIAPRWFVKIYSRHVVKRDVSRRLSDITIICLDDDVADS